MKPAFAIATVAAFASISNASAFGCKSDEVKGWMTSCDSLVDISQIRCDNKACHTALHRLVEQETLNCYASSGLGPASDLTKYKTLDDFCHGEGSDPTELAAASSATNKTTNAAGLGSLNGNISAVTSNEPVSVPATAPSAIPSPPPLPASAASTSGFVVGSTATITLTLMATTL